jgi:cystathionine beta-lyase/cystathionine gamma-synthase
MRLSVITSAPISIGEVIVDNTFATPSLWRPLKSGADLVIHSATKYLSGHGDITAGVVCGNDPEIMRSAIEYRKFVGHMLSPDDAYRLSSNIQTFDLRFRQQCLNAARICVVLKQHPSVRKVWYPGLEEHPTHLEAVKLFGKQGFGGMITFDFDGSNESEKKRKRDKFIKQFRKIADSSLGDEEYMPVDRYGNKVSRTGMIRLSAGLKTQIISKRQLSGTGKAGSDPMMS